MENIKKIKKYWELVIIALLLFIIQTIASKVGGLLAGCIDYMKFDSDNVFLFKSIHHIVQALIALAIILIFSKIKKESFHLKPVKSKVGIKYTIIFCVVIFVYVVVSYLVGIKTGMITPYNYELNAHNCLGDLGFQILLSGPSEEILFRAFPITILCMLNISEKKKEWLAILISAVFFGMAHISWNINPFSISFSWFQVVYATILGIVYGITYVKSKSVIYPMIMHSMSNIIMDGVGFLIFGVM